MSSYSLHPVHALLSTQSSGKEELEYHRPCQLTQALISHPSKCAIITAAQRPQTTECCGDEVIGIMGRMETVSRFLFTVYSTPSTQETRQAKLTRWNEQDVGRQYAQLSSRHPGHTDGEVFMGYGRMRPRCGFQIFNLWQSDWDRMGRLCHL
jgi:hypothetical protein